MDAGDSGSRVRLRQAVLVARELERAAGELQAALGLREPFRDPGVGMFGLANTVFAVGDSFLEIVSPVQPDTAAGRYLDRLVCTDTGWKFAGKQVILDSRQIDTLLALPL